MVVVVGHFQESVSAHARRAERSRRGGRWIGVVEARGEFGPQEINQLELERDAVGAFVHELKKTHRTSTATLTHDPLY